MRSAFEFGPSLRSETLPNAILVTKESWVRMPAWWLLKRSGETCACAPGYSCEAQTPDLNTAQTPSGQLALHSEIRVSTTSTHVTERIQMTSVQNTMVKHSRCEWNIVRVLDTQDLRMFRRLYRNKWHVGLYTQTLNVVILAQHPHRGG